MGALLLAVVLSQTDTLTPLLEKGPLVLVEQGKTGKFSQATSYVKVDAPPETVWAVLNDFAHYKDFVTKVVTSEVVKRDGVKTDVHLVLDVPGPDTDYVVTYAADAEKKELVAAWKKGDLKDSSFSWKVEPLPDGKTLLSERVQVKNFSSLLQSMEDDQQTITVGVNVSSALASTQSVKRRSEKLAQTPSTPSSPAPTVAH